MHLVIRRVTEGIERMDPEQKVERMPLLTPTQEVLFDLLAAEEERLANIREHGYQDAKGENTEGRRNIAEGAVAAHVEQLGTLETSVQEALEVASKEWIEQDLASADWRYPQAPLANHARFQEAIRDGLSESDFAAYKSAQVERQAIADDALREFLLHCLEVHLLLLNETHREAMREASRSLPLPTGPESSYATYFVSLLKTLPDEATGFWEQRIDVLRMGFGEEWRKAESVADQ
ncbi:MAG: hypothetical protein AAF191_01845 [Verrucomicrobiota bacterium]